MQQQQLPEKVLFVITSLVRPKDGYGSAFSTKERFEQTIETIRTIRNRLPHALIVVCEASFGEKTLIVFDDVFMFYINHDKIDCEEDYATKSESRMLQIFLQSNSYKSLIGSSESSSDSYMVCKISGRYCLAHNFSIANFHPTKISCSSRVNNSFFAFPSRMSNRVFHSSSSDDALLFKMDIIGISGFTTSGQFVLF